MNVLLVTPVEKGSGETITALHVAENLTVRGHEILFVASPFASKFIEPRYPKRIVKLGRDGAENRRAWEQARADFHPDVIVFADFTLMYFPDGCSPLAAEPGWVESIQQADASVVTLDHFGFVQGERGLFLGPPHLGIGYLEFPPLPRRMHVLLPCPMHEPGEVTGRKGIPFRYWQVPFRIEQSCRRKARRQYVESDKELLVFHSVPNWAWRAAEVFGLPFYRFLPALLEHYFGELSRGVTIVSVNNGGLLVPPPNSRVRFVNRGPIPREEFEPLLFGSDLVITENKLSISMGKAICGLRHCAALTNSFRLVELLERLDGKLRQLVVSMENIKLGSVYPYDAFPTVIPEDTEKIGLFRDNTLSRAFRELEIFGGEETTEALRQLVEDQSCRDALRGQQENYVDRLRRLPEISEILEQFVDIDRS